MAWHGFEADKWRKGFWKGIGTVIERFCMVLGIDICLFRIIHLNPNTGIENI